MILPKNIDELWEDKVTLVKVENLDKDKLDKLQAEVRRQYRAKNRAKNRGKIHIAYWNMECVIIEINNIPKMLMGKIHDKFFIQSNKFKEMESGDEKVFKVLKNDNHLNNSHLNNISLVKGIPLDENHIAEDDTLKLIIKPKINFYSPQQDYFKVTCVKNKDKDLTKARIQFLVSLDVEYYRNKMRGRINEDHIDFEVDWDECINDVVIVNARRYHPET